VNAAASSLRDWRRVNELVRVHATAALSQLTAAGAVLVLGVILSFAVPTFLTRANLFNIGVQTSITAAMAVGLTFVIITAGIDLSVAANAGLAGVIGAKLIAGAGAPAAIGVLGGVGVGGLVGLVNGVLVAWFGLAPFIATLGMMIAAQGAVLLVTNALPIALPNSFAWLGSGSAGGFPVPVLFVVGLALASHFLLNRTKPGRYFYALGSNPDAARLSGISARRYLPVVYLLCGLLAGFAGMLETSQTVSGQPNYDPNLALNAIAAAVIGGASLFGGEGTIFGSLLGALLIGVVDNGAVLLNVNPYWQDVILGVLIWLAVLFDQARRRRLAAVG
jgi:ribose transport system permease protein